jgi:hypothetical protein
MLQKKEQIRADQDNQNQTETELVHKIMGAGDQ